jgi:hypothetical protein
MKNDNKQEVWKKIKVDFEYSNALVLEVSNLGNVRSTNKIYTKRIMKPTLNAGYPCIRVKYFTARTASKQKQVDSLWNQIWKVQRNMTAMRKEGAKKKQLKEQEDVLKKYRAEMKLMTDADAKSRVISSQGLIHRWVAEYFLPKPKKGQIYVGHLDHNKTNNAVSNLKWMTQEENTEHNKKNPRVIAQKKNRVYIRNEKAKSVKLTATKVAQLKKLINKEVPLSKLALQFSISPTQILRIKRGINWGDIKPAK